MSSNTGDEEPDVPGDGPGGDIGQALLDQVRNDLDDVEVALQRLDEGNYGLCEACRQPIGSGRLAASPAARYCDEHEHVAGDGRGPGVVQSG